MKVIDKYLTEVRDAHEGILSLTLPANGGKWEDTEYFEIMDMMVSSGMDQMLTILTNPNAFKNNELATTEVVACRQGIERGADSDLMFTHTLAKIRQRYPKLTLIASGNIPCAIAYGIDRYFQKCVENGIEAIDLPVYPCIPDPFSFTARMHQNGLYNVCSLHADSIDLKNPEHVKVFDELIHIGKGEIFLVPAIPMTAGGFDGEFFKPYVDHIREVQAADNNSGCKIIAIGGIQTAEDAYQLVRVSGVDGVHFSTRFLKPLLAGESLESISAWLKTIKDAMRG